MISIRLLSIFLLIIIFVKQVSSKDQINGSKTPKHKKERSQIIRGNCKDAKDRDMVYHEVVIKNDVPFLSRNATSSWFGDYKIYCLKALNELKRKNKKTKSTALIKEGGVGHNYVTIEMHSEPGEPIEFLILVYGEKNSKNCKHGKLKRKKI